MFYKFRSLTSFSGVALIILVAISFATNSTLAKISLDHGATPLSVLTWRTALAAFSVLLILKFWGVPRVLPPRIRWISISMGGLLATYSYLLISAIEHIPVALAVLTFYLYPILTSLGSWVMGQERLTLKIVACLITAFVGLGFALNLGGEFNSLGISLATGAAIVFTILLLVNQKFVGGQESRTISLHMLSSGTFLFLVFVLIFEGFPLPQSSKGIIAYIGSGVFFSFAIIGMFVGLAKIGAIRTSLFMNFEPVSSIALGVILLDQVLTPLQLAGAGVVIASIAVAELVKEPKV